MTFQDLVFKQQKNGANGIQAVATFDNGFEVSIIKSNFSHGGKSGLFEIAIIDKSTGAINSNTDITDDVLGWQDESDIDKILAAVPQMNSEGILPEGVII
jgi:hypothetical protein